MASVYYEIYRGSALGIALIDTIDGYIRAGIIEQAHGRLILQEFDRVLADAIATTVKNKATVKARLKNYNHCEEVWKFTLQNATFKMDNGKTTVTAKQIKIVACGHGEKVEADDAPSSPRKTSPMKSH
ncbi:transcription initiation factor IIA gamma subunit [Mycena filopes]|nr:transcription initiation factor IIA gamma subunit [Mycena filopes]